MAPGCQHGMPSKASCVDCMFENGLGTSTAHATQGIYSRCAELIREGTPDTDVPSKIIEDLGNDDIRALALAALALYAGKARRQVDAEVRRATRARGKGSCGGVGAHARKRMEKSAEINRFWANTFARFQDRSYLAQEIAMGKGRRIARGDMTVADVLHKLDTLSAHRDSIGATIQDFDEHLSYLQESGHKTLFAALGEQLG